MVKQKDKKDKNEGTRKLAQSTRIISKACFNKQNSQFQQLCQTICELDNAKYSLAFSSGCSILGTILMMFSSKEHALFCDDVYGGTRRYTTRVAIDNHGIKADFIDLTQPIEEIEKKIQKNTRLIWIESPTNPTLKVCDIKKLCELANKYQLVTVSDNTFASGINQCPIQLGVDLCLTSATKYMGGHSDVISGTLSTNNLSLYKSIKRLQDMNGSFPQDFECSLVLKGLKTLHVRQEYTSKSALAIAQWLEKHPKVDKVIYPYLESHNRYELVQKQMAGGSGMITVYIKADLEKTKKFMGLLKVFICAESLGGVESLIEVPSIMTHGSVPLKEREELGILDNMARLSIGIENTKDLINDLDQALNSI